MNKNITRFILALVLIAFIGRTPADAQCNWQTVFTDGFEYTTTIPDLIAGTTIHNTPQTFAAHSGSRAMYMNFIDCVGGTGTCAGDLVYQRTISTCENMPVRVSGWFLTTFSGTQCDVKIVLSDSAGNGLDSINSLLAGYSPNWTQWTSGTINPSGTSFILSIYTNVGGTNGNDLSVDDLKLERCASTNSATGVPVCNNISAVDLYSYLPNNPVSTGTWTGPSSLTNGYLGTFTTGVNTGGTYIYNSAPYGTAVGCPLRIDTIVAFPAVAPIINLGNDTTLCTNQNYTITAGTSSSNTYNWSTGANTGNIVVNSSAAANNSYSVVVTNTSGCTGSDTLAVSFVVCSGIEENGTLELLAAFPNPSNGTMTIQAPASLLLPVQMNVRDASSRLVFTTTLRDYQSTLSLPSIENGVYMMNVVTSGMEKMGSRLIIVNN
jgi:hypothetical protein